MQLASIGRRFLALLIDGVVLFILNKVVHFIPLIGQIPLIMFFAFIAYSAWLESSKYRGTLGKIALGIEVGDMEGNPISVKTAILRAVGKIISLLIMFLGFIFAFFGDKKQALHDIIAKTQVIDGPKPPEEA